MDDVEVLTATLNNTLQRQSRITQSYEVEIANMTAEIVRLQSQLEAATAQLAELSAGNTTVEASLSDE
jgi:septal ring factor EnvC (AmiA/AmiB activator)